MKLHKLAPKIYQVQLKKQHDLFLTFIRFQEYCESPKFKGKIFTLDQFKKWYIKSSKDNNQELYYQDWQAFNIPSFALLPFYEGKFNPLSEQEKELLKLLKNIKKGSCIIGTYKKRNKLDLKHEVAHGLYYTNSKYRKQVNKILKQITSAERKHLANLLLKTEGYSKKVLNDELHAYILADLNSLKRNKIKISNLKNIHDNLVKNFKRFYKR